jgi:YihY family inner membrane protein
VGGGSIGLVDALLERLRRTLAVRLAVAYGTSQSSSYASVVAFNAFMTMFPLILGLLAILGFVVRDHAVEARVQDAIVGFFPTTGGQSAPIVDALQGVRHNAGLFGLVSLAGLLYTGTNFFSALEFALDQIYGVPLRSFVRQRALGLLMLLAFVAALLISVGASALVALAPFAGAPLGLLVGAGVMVGLLILIYKVVPNRRQSWRKVVPGAVLCGVLIEVLTLVWPLYTRVMHNFNSYGSAFALFFLLATWLFFLSQLILLGGVLNRLLEGGQPVPQPEAVAQRPGGEDAQRRRAEVQPAGRPRPEI